jgi:hypothetical protein
MPGNAFDGKLHDDVERGDGARRALHDRAGSRPLQHSAAIRLSGLLGILTPLRCRNMI